MRRESKSELLNEFSIRNFGSDGETSSNSFFNSEDDRCEFRGDIIGAIESSGRDTKGKRWEKGSAQNRGGRALGATRSRSASPERHRKRTEQERLFCLPKGHVRRGT